MSEAIDALAFAKQELLDYAENEAEYKATLSRLDARQLKEIQKDYWNFLIEESQKAKTPISRGDILSRLEPTAKYQRRARCKEPEGYCTISMCVRINPRCAITRISEIMLAIRPLVVQLLSERPELRTYFKPAESDATKEPQTLGERQLGAAKEIAPEEEARPRRERVPEFISEETKQAFQKYKEALWRMVEGEGLEHAILMSEGGTILVRASLKPQELERLSAVVSDEIFAATEQGEAAGLNRLLTVTKEYDDGVVAIRSIGEKLYLVGVSRIVLPGKIHSLIVRLGDEISKEISKTN
ncbi:MAG: roadblock/LC7 domain-containing protein [Chloroherpetonaceae bacterium]|nr:roadblock/LC7 domain-containing protein [Chloroherpetonaceae bacterium]MDW8437002.1 roadblock/LC7 domain-containing protein [Chloroherpetonaceae bacterium]